MTEVITRPAQAEAVNPNTGGSRGNTRAALLKLKDLLILAARTGEAHAYSGESDRLLRIASTLAGQAVEAVRADQDQIVRTAFDVAALVHASRLVPGDTESAERSALLARCLPIVRGLTNDAREDFMPHGQRPELIKAGAQEVAAYDPGSDIGDALAFATQAHHVLRMAGHMHDDACLLAVAQLVQAAKKQGELASMDKGEDACTDFSVALAYPIALIDALTQEYSDNELFFAADSLLNFAKAKIDDACGHLTGSAQ